MDNDNFYVDLPSDASMQQFPSNHGGEYTVALPITLHLSSHQWEVGLTEAIFTQEWAPIAMSDVWVQFCKDNGSGKFEDCGEAYIDGKKVAEVDLKDFEAVWNKLLAPMFKAAMEKADLWPDKGTIEKQMALTSSKESKRITLKITPKIPTKKEDIRGIRLELSKTLQEIMGYTRSQLKGEASDTVVSAIEKRRYFFSNSAGEMVLPQSFFQPEIQRGINSLWVYSDLIRAHITGHTFSQLLRVIAVDHTKGVDNASRVVHFDQVHYYPLIQDDIRTIRVKITNQGGIEPVKFASPVVLKLHFRRKRSRS